MSNKPASGRLIDPRGHRFGAALSVVVLAVAFLTSQPLVVALIAVALGVSAAFGTRYSALGRPWPLVRRVLRLASPRELESEYPPRFAQALGSVGLSIALLAFLAGLPLLGWLLTGAVAGLQAVLALTGYCLGCRLYFLRWWLPAAFGRLVGAQRG
ncbi:MAG TPA: DUF4395 domain-containing protein [Candidatus Limnocylindria bacterium]|nr:DUF4395 domain-containing protein [Candidatus Limnocylindria bacterium]